MDNTRTGAPGRLRPVIMISTAAINVVTLGAAGPAPGAADAAAVTDAAGFWDGALARLAATAPPDPRLLWPAAVVVFLAWVLPWLRRWSRALTTLVHEAGHAAVGMLVGRRFHGFVVEGDLSGRAVTSGRSRGPGRCVTAWAGYPMPALVGAGAVLAALAGWAGTVLAAALVVLAVLLVMSRSVRTAGLVTLCGAAVAALWWWGDADAAVPVRAGVVAGVGLLLVAGAWESLGDVARSRDGGADHRTLARLTPLPAGFWWATWALVDAGVTWLVLRSAAELW
ncbi:Peptidase M50B-like [Actinomyces ruminicola]|uniref:Peptidase M50B-like n=2 Tax=Actinomyces ruminicola TaxID=332524 RepID=A0A1G9RWW8_9ACTO|nr:Peptidase M50B-like [Actinomyces ruminicola]